MILDRIKKANDIKKIDKRELKPLAAEIRKVIISAVNRNGGHLASNLGVVELTMALHLAFDLPKDKIIFDVGHQSYTHKILTGRLKKMSNLRQYKGISGFPNIKESDCDCFETGHATTSISAAYGMARARDINKENYSIAAVIGDGAMTGGMAYEALNNAASLKSNLMIILNDNNMSIGRNIGGMSKALSDIRMANSYAYAKDEVKRILNKLPIVGDTAVKAVSKIKSSLKQLMLKGMIFENMGITYIGPINGKDIELMYDVFNEAKTYKGCVLIHVVTQKGYGYKPAMVSPDKFHSASKNFLTNNDNVNKKNSFAEDLSNELLLQAKYDKSIVAITAAMTSGTGLDNFAKRCPDRFFDVGIAEEHAVTMAAGMAGQGLYPVVAIYSTFLQRAYDQLLNDVGGMNLPMLFIIDRAGFVSSDGRTHQGIYDISYLATIPNLITMASTCLSEFYDMFKWSLKNKKLAAIRIPKDKSNAYSNDRLYDRDYDFGTMKARIIKKDGYKQKNSVLFVALGNMMATAIAAIDVLSRQGIKCSLINAVYANPIDVDTIYGYAKEHKLTVSLEENITEGGFGQRLHEGLCDKKFKRIFLNISIKNQGYPTASVEKLHKLAGIDKTGVLNRIYDFIEVEGK